MTQASPVYNPDLYAQKLRQFLLQNGIDPDEVSQAPQAPQAPNPAAQAATKAASKAAGMYVRDQIAGKGASSLGSSSAGAAQLGGTSSGAIPVGTAANGGTLMSDGTIAAAGAAQAATAGSAAVPVASAAEGGVLMSDGTVAAMSANPSVVGGAQGAQGTAYFDVGAPSWAGYIAAAFDAYKGYKALTDDDLSAQEKATKAQQMGALAVADVYTGGLSGMAEGYARGQYKGSMEKLDALDAKYNPITRIATHYGGKSKDQMQRDKIREALQDAGLMDETWNIGFSHGGKFNTAQGTKDEWKVDLTDKTSAAAQAKIDALATIMAGTADTDNKARQALAGFLTNAVTKAGGNVDQNAYELYAKAGLKDKASVENQLKTMLDSKKIKDSDVAANSSAFNDVFSKKAVESVQRSMQEQQKSAPPKTYDQMLKFYMEKLGA